MRKTLAAGAVLLMCALSACGGSDGGGSDASTGDKPDTSGETTAVFDACKSITPAEAEAVLGYPVTVEETPGGGCSWGSEEDPRLASLSVSAAGEADVNGGLEAAKAGTTAVLDGEAEDVPGLGDGAFLVIGPLKGGGGESIQAQGSILSGTQLITVGITQLGGAAVTADAVKAQADAGLKLVGSKL
ncbi:hypothetical protein J2X11_000520 [Aeromicrobium panaciterrae]|uniref:DUF3558 domain-containing protein n=1 Tax=Aeromicrobium panaciterrae TaxID=363861 RepID=A0ABU1UKJ1_9ACTN|nr:hypothetical protein [Aeromicrobium panaciterrae]MDR7085681.1 hypothetical protein [Aeromicrobium panaciterrae]